MTVNAVSNLERVKQGIAQAAIEAGRNPADITLVAVSKYSTVEDVERLVDVGHLDFGENRVQDGLAKLEALRNTEVRWHLIGRIQTNKIKYISPFFLVHSLDRWDLAVKMSEFAMGNNLEYQCLLQVNVAGDPAKAGIGIDDVDSFITRAAQLKGIVIRGLMTITALDADPGQTWTWYKTMAAKFHNLRPQKLPGNVDMNWLSMGMSDDYKMAIAAGSNIVRVGSAIFTAEGE